MNLKEMKEMIQLMNENDLTELELEQDGLKIRLKKNRSGQIEPAISGDGGMSQNIPLGEMRQPPPAIIPQPPRTIIKSPMVGTFYLSPAPDAAAFVQVGSAIQVAQVICIIEAMKLMNEIKSEHRGKIVEILALNGDPVEFGQPLFAIE